MVIIDVRRMVMVQVVRNRVLHADRRVPAAHPREGVSRREGAPRELVARPVGGAHDAGHRCLGAADAQVEGGPPGERGRHDVELHHLRVVVGVDGGVRADGGALLHGHGGRLRRRPVLLVLVPPGAAAPVRHGRRAPVSPSHLSSGI